MKKKNVSGNIFQVFTFLIVVFMSIITISFLASVIVNFIKNEKTVTAESTVLETETNETVTTSENIETNVPTTVAKQSVSTVSFWDVFLKVLASNILIFGVLFFIIIRKVKKVSNKIASSINPEDISKISMDAFSSRESALSMRMNKNIPNVAFDDVEGLPEVKKEAQTLIKYLKNPYKYKNVGARMPKGVILYGPPGTGKTLIAKAIAGTAGVPFLSVSGSDFMEMYVGVGAKRVRQLFAEANKLAPCIVFIDEIDAIGAKRGEHQSGERDQTINALLAEMDGFNSNNGVMIIAATNRLDILDPALIRAGRFDKHIAVGLPNKDERLSILRLHSKDKKIDETVNLQVIASQTTGFSGADLESLLNEAAILSVNNNKNAISKEEIDRAFFKVVMKGDIKENKKRSQKELETVAWHEAGHALVTKLLTNDEVTKVTILASTSGAGGVTFHNPPEEEGLYSKKDLKNRIAICYGGRAAEEILFGNKDQITIGASQDIQNASHLIRAYIMKYGMSEEFGLIDVDVFDRQSISNEKVISEAVKIANEFYEYTLNTLKENRYYLEEIATQLLEKETLLDEDINKILGRVSDAPLDGNIEGQLQLSF